MLGLNELWVVGPTLNRTASMQDIPPVLPSWNSGSSVDITPEQMADRTAFWVPVLFFKAILLVAFDLYEAVVALKDKGQFEAARELLVEALPRFESAHDIFAMKWDVILVDAPNGNPSSLFNRVVASIGGTWLGFRTLAEIVNPGRMGAICASSLLAGAQAIESDAKI